MPKIFAGSLPLSWRGMLWKDTSLPRQKTFISSKNSSRDGAPISSFNLDPSLWQKTLDEKNLVARVQGRHAYMHEENGRRHGTSKTHYIVMHHYVFPLFLMGNGDFIFLRVSWVTLNWRRLIRFSMEFNICHVISLPNVFAKMVVAIISHRSHANMVAKINDIVMVTIYPHFVTEA